MTIQDLNDKIDAIRGVRERLDDLSGMMSEISKLTCSKKSSLPEETKSEIRTRMGIISQTVSTAKTQLYDYNSLLSDIVRTTKISWPPSCPIVDQTKSDT